MDIPPPLKWAGGIVAGIAIIAVSAYFNWLTVSVNAMTGTLIRMEERMGSANSRQESQFADIDRRLRRLEDFHEAKK